MLSLIFVLGGVSILDLIRLTVSLFISGIYIGSIGIFCSTVSKSTTKAAISSYISVAFLTFGTIAMTKLIYFLLSVRAEQLEVYQKPDIGPMINILLFNPLVSYFGILSQQVGNGYELVVLCNTMGDFSNDFTVIHMLGISVVMQLLVSCLLLYLAGRKLNAASHV